VVHPDRPIPSKKIPAGNALLFSTFAFCGSIILSSFINLSCLIIAGLSVSTLILYELKLKSQGFAGNLCIAFLVGLLFLFGGAVVGLTPALSILCILAGISTLGREIAKDIVDIEGDKIGRKTLPMSLGVATSKKLAALLIVVAIILSPLPYFLGMSIYYIYLVIPANLLFLLSSVQFFDHPSRSAKTIKSGMGIALAAFLAGGIG
jgi:geranylgeranylglycerol-phosphate geranylgeranyltransferase